MTSTHPVAHHGDATLSLDVHDGLIEYVLVIDHVKVRITDQQARDARHCFADLFPYTDEHNGFLGAEVHGYDNGIPVRTLHMREKACGCGVLVGEGCDCHDTGWSK